MNNDGSNPQHLNDFVAFDAHWSKVSDQFVYYTDGIWKVSLSNRIPQNILGSSLGGADPSWSPDGSKITYAFSPRGNEYREIYTMNADGSNQRQLTSNPSRKWTGAPSWSPDGRTIAFSSQLDGHTQIYLIEISSGIERQLTNVVGGACQPSWRSY